MGGKVLSFADLPLARRIETTDAWVGLESARIHAQLHPDSGATAIPVPGGYAVFTGVGSPLTQVLGLGMDGPVNGPQLDELEEFFRFRGAVVSIEHCPLADPSVVTLMGERGYRLASFSNMLARRLSPSDRMPPAPGVVVRGCRPDEAELWSRTVLEGFMGDHAVNPENTAVLTSLFHQQGSICLLSWVDDQPAGGGALSVREGVAALYGASTIPAYRRRGVQSAVIQALVAQAHEHGCDLAYTLTGPGSTSQRNLERQDFRIAYTRATMVRNLE